jgi:2-dehydro-3-deoxygluconokinase
VPYVDWYLCGLDEGRALFGVDDVAAAARAAGARDAHVRARNRADVEVVDEVGAGDAFAAGFALGLLEGREREDCVRLGDVVAPGALRGTGDWETLPRRDELSL